MFDGPLALLIGIGGILLGVGAGRYLRLRHRFDLAGVNRVLLTVAQGLLLLALLGGLDQRPLARAALFSLPMAAGWGMVTALSPGGEPAGRWWQLWRWRFISPRRGPR